MFTGLIEEVGLIKNIQKSSIGCVLTVSCSKISSDVSIGDSIAVNGVCQTVVEFGTDYFKTELSNETLNISNFKDIKVSEKVNLERALAVNKRLDGHIVNGHIECIAQLSNIKTEGFSKIYSFKMPKKFLKYVAYKGSIAVSGVSTTVCALTNESFSVAIIPTTLEKTNFEMLKIGDFVNIETDILAKYVEKILLSNNNTCRIDNKLLQENGFI